MGWLLDTNVLSELRKPKAEPRVAAYVAAKPLRELCVSVVSLAEIRYGIELTLDASKRFALLEWLDLQVRPMFGEERTLLVTEDILLTWRTLLEEGRKAGHTFSQPDLLIGATASHHGLTVVSRDVVHYRRARVPVVNPWIEI